MLRRAIPIAALSLAAAALFFALWPVVADAPWEDEAAVIVVPTVDRTAELRCEGAYGLRDAIISAGPYISESQSRDRTRRMPGGERVVIPGDHTIGNPGGIRNYDEALAGAQRDIDRYC